jgi:hypothetical protein
MIPPGVRGDLIVGEGQSALFRVAEAAQNNDRDLTKTTPERGVIPAVACENDAVLIR